MRLHVFFTKAMEYDEFDLFDGVGDCHIDIGKKAEGGGHYMLPNIFLKPLALVSHPP